jgi:hypothetical protein
MRQIRRLMLVVVLGLSTTAWARQAGSLIGVWKCNVAKSLARDGKPLTDMVSRTDRYEKFGKDGIRYSSEETTTDGKTRKTTYAAEFGGKYFPMTGSPAAGDHVALFRIDAYTTESKFQRDGKDAGVSRRVVSKDGKTMTYTGGRGTLVFDRQK